MMKVNRALRFPSAYLLPRPGFEDQHEIEFKTAERQSARLTLAEKCKNSEELSMFLSMLGLDSNEIPPTILIS